MADRKSKYDGYTEVRKQANLKYMAKFAYARVRMEPEKLDAIKEYLDGQVGMSISGWINGLIDAELERNGIKWSGS